MSADRQQQGGGLSVQTLLVASLASMTAAVVIHEFWAYGAILGAAITPVIVALTSEALKKPVDRATRLAQERRSRERAASRPRDEDRFGIWQADRPEPWHRRLDRRHVRLALVTGLVAFAIGAVALTAGLLVFGGWVGVGGYRTTLVPGDRRDRDRDREPATTEPAAPAPDHSEPAPDDGDPDQTAPPATQSQDDPVEPEPGATTPPEPQPGAPAPGQTTPAPAGEAPAG